jgi:exopolysaccharide production protein ExoY
MRSDVTLPEEAKAKLEKNYKLENDPRVTKIGYILRKSSFDEVPQLWNVIKGDMALVGPRPVTANEIELMFGDKSDVVTSVRPGITGLWQVSGRSSLKYSERIALDTEYVYRRSLWLDVKILFKTIPAVLRTHQTS